MSAYHACALPSWQFDVGCPRCESGLEPVHVLPTARDSRGTGTQAFATARCPQCRTEVTLTLTLRLLPRHGDPEKERQRKARARRLVEE